MNPSVGFVPVPARNSLTLTGLTFRTFSVIASDCLPRRDGPVQDALPVRPPLKATGPEVTWKVALTLAPGGPEPNVFDVSVLPATTDLHCLLAPETLSRTPAAGAPVVFVNVTVESCAEPGVNVC